MKKKYPVAAAIALAAVFAFFAACEMEVAEEAVLKPIITPYISVAPKSDSYSVGDPVANLKAQVWDWDAKDGELSYQWYRFDSGTVADFIENGEGEAIDETEGGFGLLDPDDAVDAGGVMVNSIELDLSGKTFNQDTFYYYYLEITNSDASATNAKAKAARSEIATLSFSASGSAKYPVITRQPANSRYQFGRNLVIAELSVRASSPDGGTLSYQWYYDPDRAGNTDVGDLDSINGETKLSYRPTIDKLEPGANYFFVEVTNTVGGTGATTLLSVPALVDMEAGLTALEPVISRQPQDRLYFATDAIKPLTVEAEELIDGGTIGYQWYRNTSNSARNGTALSGNGADTDSYTPAITADGTYYFYVTVTNTNPSVKSSVKTARTNSRAVTVIRTTGQTIAQNAIVTVQDPRNPGSRYQYIRGYGGMDTAWANFPEQKPADMETMYNPDWGLGYNINRIMISPANTNVNISIVDLINSHRPYYYENVKIVNKYGGYNLASPWSPPKEWKTNNSINGGGKLINAYRQQYADYLRAFARHMFDAGAPIYAISISNEPNYTAGYDGCEWDPEDMRDFFKNISPQPYTTGVRGYGGGKDLDRVMIMNGESANTPYINVLALRDAESRSNIDLLARHVYGETGKNLWRVVREGGTGDSPTTMGGAVSNNFSAVSSANSILKRDDGTFYEVWMTEHNINSANATAYPNDSTWNYLWRFMNDVDLVMRLSNENAFVWWAAKRFYSLVGDGQFGTRDGAVLPRGIGLSHYAKYTIDTHRIGVNVTGTFADGTTSIGPLETASSAVNQTSFNLDNTAVRVTAYASIKSGKDNKPVTDFKVGEPDALGWDEIEYISLVMWAPTSTSGSSGRNLGTVRLAMPTGFIIGGVSAHKSRSARSMFQSESVTVNAARTQAYVTLGAGEVLSVKLTRQQ